MQMLSGELFVVTPFLLTIEIFKLQELCYLSYCRSVVTSLDDDTIVFVLGDHGMTSMGDHGGETELETDAALLIYSPRPIFNPHQVS